MKPGSFTLPILAILLCLLFISCEDDSNENCSGNFLLGQSLAEESFAVAKASQAYFTNETEENCKDYKEAQQEYIRELKKLKDCAYQNDKGEEYEDMLEEAEDSLEDLC